MKKWKIGGILAAVICAALLLIFFQTRSVFDVAWGQEEDPATMQIGWYNVWAGTDPAISVTLSGDEISAFMDQLQDVPLRHSSPLTQKFPETAAYRVWMKTDHAMAMIRIDEDGHLISEYKFTQDRSKSRGTYRFTDQVSYEELLQTCRSYTDPNGNYPGLAFLAEFFSIGKDGRTDHVWLDAPDGVYGGDAVETLYSGIEPYMTEHGFNSVMMSRSLYNLEYICKQKGGSWYCDLITIEAASEPGYYNYEAGFFNSATANVDPFMVNGSYSVDKDGLVDSFYIDLD